MKCFHWFGVSLNLLTVSLCTILFPVFSMLVSLILFDIFTGSSLMLYLIVLYAVNLIFLLIVHTVKRLVIVYLNPDVDFVTKSHVMECIRKRDAMYVSNPSSLGFLKTKIFFLNREEYRLVRRAVARAESKKVKNSITRHSLKK